MSAIKATQEYDEYFDNNGPAEPDGPDQDAPSEIKRDAVLVRPQATERGDYVPW